MLWNTNIKKENYSIANSYLLIYLKSKTYFTIKENKKRSFSHVLCVAVNLHTTVMKNLIVVTRLSVKTRTIKVVKINSFYNYRYISRNSFATGHQSTSFDVSGQILMVLERLGKFLDQKDNFRHSRSTNLFCSHLSIFAYFIQNFPQVSKTSMANEFRPM